MYIGIFAIHTFSRLHCEILIKPTEARNHKDSLCQEAFHEAGRLLAKHVLAVIPSANPVIPLSLNMLSIGFHM